jgi:purine-binding chemotaxis protein CheW
MLRLQESTLQVACFRAGGRECAVDVLRISEVVRPRPVTPLPAAPQFVEGLIELRGRFLPVIDLRRRFGDADPTDRALGKYLVAPMGATSVALVVDEVTGVERIPLHLIQPPPTLAAASVTPPFVSGLLKWDDRVLFLLDLEAVLTAGEQSQLAAL